MWLIYLGRCVKASITALVLSLYIAFSVFVISNVTEDLEMTRRVVTDATMIATKHELDSSWLEYRSMEGQGSGERLAFVVMALGLFFGTIGYLIATCVDNWQSQLDLALGPVR